MFYNGKSASISKISFEVLYFEIFKFSRKIGFLIIYISYVKKKTE